MTTKTNLTVIGVIIAATIGSVAGAFILYGIGRILDVERLEKIVDRWGHILESKRRYSPCRPLVSKIWILDGVLLPDGSISPELDIDSCRDGPYGFFHLSFFYDSRYDNLECHISRLGGEIG